MWPRCDGNNNCGQIIVQSLIPKIFIAGYISYLQTIRTPKKKSVRFFTVYAKTVSNTEIFSCVCQTAILIQAPCALSPIAGDPYTPVVCHQNSRLPLYLYGSHPEKIKENIILKEFYWSLQFKNLFLLYFIILFNYYFQVLGFFFFDTKTLSKPNIRMISNIFNDRYKMQGLFRLYVVLKTVW